MLGFAARIVIILIAVGLVIHYWPQILRVLGVH